MSPSVLLVNDGNIVDDSGKHGTDADSDSSSALLHRSLHHDPLHVVGAEGNYLHLSNGERILDASGGAAVACIGHGNVRYGCLECPLILPLIILGFKKL